ncbi:MAG: hypothetical protein JWQ49_3118 [Edaphobacter sp.]|nr:hypothetical protein [Edaphobacter sp.]
MNTIVRPTYSVYSFALKNAGGPPGAAPTMEALMKNVLTFVLLSAIAGIAQVPSSPLTSPQIQDAIAKGKQYRTRDRYLDGGIKAQKIRLAGAFAGDGISKYLIFFTDYDIVAAAAADAAHQMREFSDVDAKNLPLSGLTLVNVQLHARGDFPVRRLQQHFIGQNLHLVLQIGNTVIQPVARSDVRDSGVMPADGPLVVRYWTNGNTSLITTDRLGFSAERIEVEFAFQIPPEIAAAKAKAILIDGEGKHYVDEVDLAKIRHVLQ